MKEIIGNYCGVQFNRLKAMAGRGLVEVRKTMEQGQRSNPFSGSSIDVGADQTQVQSTPQEKQKNS